MQKVNFGRVYPKIYVIIASRGKIRYDFFFFFCIFTFLNNDMYYLFNMGGKEKTNIGELGVRVLAINRRHTQEFQQRELN